MAAVPARRLSSASPAVQRALRRFQGAIFARLNGLGGGTNEREVPFQSRAMVRPKFQNGQPAPGEVLLIAKVLVGKNEEGDEGQADSCVFQTPAKTECQADSRRADGPHVVKCLRFANSAVSGCEQAME